MPPKKTEKKQKVEPIIINGQDVSLLTRDQTETFVLGLIDDLNRAREKRAKAQGERDKIYISYYSCKQEVEETFREIHELDTIVGSKNVANDNQLEFGNARIKYLRYQNKFLVGLQRKYNKNRLKETLIIEQNKTDDLQLQKFMLKSSWNERYVKFDEMLKSQEIELSRDYQKRQLKHQQNVEREEQNFQEALRRQRRKLEFIFRMNKFEFLERKNTHLTRLRDAHYRVSNRLKEYYNENTMTMVGLVKSLKEHVAMVRKQYNRSERIYQDLSAINKTLTEPLAIAKIDLHHLRQKMGFHTRNMKQLARLESSDVILDRQLKIVNEQMTELLRRNDRLDKGQEALNDSVSLLLTNIYKKADMPNQKLQKKVIRSKIDAQKCETLVQEKLDECGCKAELVEAIDKSVRAVFDKKQKQMDYLKYALPRMVKARNELVATLGAKAAQLGVPAQQADMSNIVVKSKIKYLQGPASLVAENP